MDESKHKIVDSLKFNLFNAFDMVYDKIIHRWIGPMIIVYLLYRIISAAFISSKSESLFPNQIQVILPPSRYMELGSPALTFVAQILDQNNNQMVGIEVSLEIQNLVVQYKNGQINCDFTYISQYYWTYYFLRALGPCSIEINGTIEKSLEGGFTYFKKFIFQKAPQGNYYVYFHIKNSKVSSQAFSVFLSPTVLKIQILNNPPKTAIIGKPLDIQPQIIAFNKYGDTLSNKVFDAISWPYGNHDLHRFAPLFDPDIDKFAFLEGAKSNPSNSSGYCEFANLTILGSTHISVYIIIISEGVELFAPWKVSQFPNLKVDILKIPIFYPPIQLQYANKFNITFIRELPLFEKEGIEFQDYPMIKILNEYNEPIQGFMCFALLRELNGYKFPHGHQPQNHREYSKKIIKGLTGNFSKCSNISSNCAVPVFSDKNGFTEFREIGISKAGTNYAYENIAGIKFICGNHITQIKNITIKSSIGNVEFIQLPTFVNYSSPIKFGIASVGDFIIYIEDENHYPFSNKSVNDIYFLNSSSINSNISNEIFARNYYDYSLNDPTELQSSENGILYSRIILYKSSIQYGNFFLGFIIDGKSFQSKDPLEVFIDTSLNLCHLIVLDPPIYNFEMKDDQVKILPLYWKNISGKSFLSPDYTEFQIFDWITIFYRYSNEDISSLYYPFNYPIYKYFTLNRKKFSINYSLSLQGFPTGTYSIFVITKSSENSEIDNCLSNYCNNNKSIVINYINSISKVKVIDPEDQLNPNINISVDILARNISLQIFDEENQPLRSFKIQIDVRLYEFSEFYTYNLLFENPYGSGIILLTNYPEFSDNNGLINFTLNIDNLKLIDFIFSFAINGISSPPINLHIDLNINKLKLTNYPPTYITYYFFEYINSSFTVEIESSNKNKMMIPIIAFFKSYDIESNFDMPYTQDENNLIVFNQKRLSYTDITGIAKFGALRLLGFDNSNSKINCIIGYFYFKLGLSNQIESNRSPNYTICIKKDAFQITLEKKHDSDMIFNSELKSKINFTVKEPSSINLLSQDILYIFNLRIVFYEQKSVPSNNSFFLTYNLFDGMFCYITLGSSYTPDYRNKPCYASKSSLKIENSLFFRYEIGFYGFSWKSLEGNKQLNLVPCIFSYCNYTTFHLYGMRIMNYRQGIDTSREMRERIMKIGEETILTIIPLDSAYTPIYVNIYCNIVSINISYKGSEILYSLLAYLTNNKYEPDLLNILSKSSRIKINDSYSNSLLNFKGQSNIRMQITSGKSGFYFFDCESEFGDTTKSNIFYVDNQISSIVFLNDIEHRLISKFVLQSSEFIPKNITFDFGYKIVILDSLFNPIENLIEKIEIELYTSDSINNELQSISKDLTILDQFKILWNVILKGDDPFITSYIYNIITPYEKYISFNKSYYIINQLTFRFYKPDTYFIKVICLGIESNFSQPIIIVSPQYEILLEFLGYYSDYIFYICGFLIFLINSVYLSKFSLGLSIILLSFSFFCSFLSFNSIFDLILGSIFYIITLILLIYKLIDNSINKDISFFGIRKYIYEQEYFLLKLSKLNTQIKQKITSTSLRLTINKFSLADKDFIYLRSPIVSSNSPKSNLQNPCKIKIAKLLKLFAQFDSYNCFYFPQRLIMGLLASIITLIYCSYLFIMNGFVIIDNLIILQNEISGRIFGFINTLITYTEKNFSFEIPKGEYLKYLNIIQTFLDIFVNFEKSLKIAIVIAIVITVLIFFFSFISMLFKFEDIILGGRKSITIERRYKRKDISKASQFVGSMIGNTVISFFIVSILLMIIIGISISKYFWIIILENWKTLLIIIIPKLIISITSMILPKIIFHENEIMHSFLMQINDIFNFVLSLLDGIAASANKIICNLIYLFISIIRFDKNVFPKWLKIPFLSDNMFKSFESLIRLHMIITNPIFNALSNQWIQRINHYRITRSTRKIWKIYILIKFPNLKTLNKLNLQNPKKQN